MNDGPGRSNVVPDEKILRQLAGPDPVYSTSEVTEDIEIGLVGTNRRLKKLKDRSLVDGKKIGNGWAWWLTSEGREYLEDASE